MKRIFRRLIRYFNLGFAILLVLSFLSPHISPAKWWIPSFLGLAYPYILLFNIIFLVFWILMKKREWVISFFAILLGWSTLTSYFSLHPGSLFRKANYETLTQDELKANKLLKVMSFNVRAFDRYRWNENPSVPQDIIKMFQSNNPDIICLQEFYSSTRGPMQLEDIYAALDRTPYRHMEFIGSRRGSHYGLAIFSRYPILASGRLELNNSQGAGSFADITVFGDTLRIYNMHLQSTRLNSGQYQILDDPKLKYDDQQMNEIRDISFRLRGAFIKRAGQADRIAVHIEKCPYPLILCGDFNDTPISYSYHRISEQLTDAFSNCGWGIGRTYNGKFPSFRIDYILYRGEFESVHFTRIKKRLSDHSPIVSYLEFSN